MNLRKKGYFLFCCVCACAVSLLFGGTALGAETEDTTEPQNTAAPEDSAQSGSDKNDNDAGAEKPDESIVRLNKKKMTVVKGCKYRMTSYTSKNLTWKSSKPKTVSIRQDSTVKALKTGTAVISAVWNGKTVAKCTMKVIKFKPVKMKKLKCYKKYRKYMSEGEFKKAYKKACKLIKYCAGFDKKEKLNVIAGELRAIVEKNISSMYSMKKKHYNDPYGYLIKHTASCAGCTRATGLCLNILGISFEHINENKYKHQWCRVKVGREYWICDAYGLYVGKEPGKRKHPYF